jgi:uncharacterized protein YndB with AHSA1/START domain
MKERFIFGEIEIPAQLDQVWEAWTTERGIKSFFAPDCQIDLNPDGMYEIYFDPSAAVGEKGGEGLRVMAVQPMQMLSFSWNAPTTLPEVRQQRTHVVVRLYAMDENLTRVTLYHDGWGTGFEWDQAYNYFQQAWLQIVLPRLRYRFEFEPIDWEDPPGPDDLAKLISGS